MQAAREPRAGACMYEAIIAIAGGLPWGFAGRVGGVAALGLMGGAAPGRPLPFLCKPCIQAAGPIKILEVNHT